MDLWTYYEKATCKTVLENTDTQTQLNLGLRKNKMPPLTLHLYQWRIWNAEVAPRPLFLRTTSTVYLGKKQNTKGKGYTRKILHKNFDCIFVNICFALIGKFWLWISVLLYLTNCDKCCVSLRLLRFFVMLTGSWIPAKGVCSFFPIMKCEV